MYSFYPLNPEDGMQRDTVSEAGTKAGWDAAQLERYLYCAKDSIVRFTYLALHSIHLQ